MNVRLRQSSGDEPLAEVNLAEFLAANPIIDCTKQEVLIPIRIEFKEGQITVSVPEWYNRQNQMRRNSEPDATFRWSS